MKAGAESAHPNTCFATNWALPGICKVNSKTFQWGGGGRICSPQHMFCSKFVFARDLLVQSNVHITTKVLKKQRKTTKGNISNIVFFCFTKQINIFFYICFFSVLRKDGNLAKQFHTVSCFGKKPFQK